LSQLLNCQETVQQQPRRFQLSWRNPCFHQNSTNNDRDLCTCMSRNQI